MFRFLRSTFMAGLVWLVCLPMLTAPVCGAEPAADPVEAAMDHVRNLEYDMGRQELQSWLTQRPSDLRALNCLASAILQKEMFQRELLESRVYVSGGEAFRGGRPPASAAFQRELFGILNQAEALSQERLRQNPRDEQALYWMGAAHATRAIFHLVIARANTTALGEAKEARNYHIRALTLNPNFVDAMLVVGIYDYVLGSLPWYVKVLASIVGYRGDKARGLAAMERVTREGTWAKAEARQFLAIFYYREKRYAETLALLQEMGRAHPRNFIVPQEIARTYKAQGNWRLAAGTYDLLLARHRKGNPGYRALPVTKILFQAGEAHARMGETAQALRLYEEAAGCEENNIFAYRADFAAAGVYEQQNRPEDARRRYERVARAIPATDEGKAARQYLKRLQ